MPIDVRVRDCACPETPHQDEGDLVYLRDHLSAEGGIAAEQEIVKYDDDDERTRAMLLLFVRHGATGWNLVDENGPREFDVDELLDDWTMARPVTLAAGEAYLEAVMNPLVRERSERSPTGPTRATTSRRQRPTPQASAPS